jgi:uncharacterized protein
MRAMQSLLLFIVAFIAAPAFAQQGPWEKALLWQVQKGEQKLFLLGSLSVGKRAFYPLPRNAGEAIRASDVVIFEADSEDVEASQRALQLGVYEGEERLDKNIPRDLYEELSTLALNYDIPEEQLTSFRPWMLYFQIIFKEFANAGFVSDFSVERVMYELAKVLKKDVSAMESADAASKYLNTVDPKLQEAMLRGLLLELKDAGAIKALDDLWNAMRKGDAEQFMAAVDANEKFYPRGPELRETLFYARHPAMLEKLEGYLASGKTHMVVLGAVNLPGERGLLEALRKKGYEVKQL